MKPASASPVLRGIQNFNEQTAAKLMNNPGTSHTGTIPTPTNHLLESIRTIRASVGDGLNDDELTRLLRETALPAESGFAFLSFSDGCVTLSVPRQNPAYWYPKKGWIAAEKERMARAIAAKYQLSLCEPPDQTPSCLFPRSDPPTIHHHLELTNQVETIVVAHPHYLKIRLFGAAPPGWHVWNAQTPVPLGPELLQDLSALYQA
jgi:hypothetical protein